MFDKKKMTGGLGQFAKVKMANRMMSAAPGMPERKADMVARAPKLGNMPAKMGKPYGRA